MSFTNSGLSLKFTTSPEKSILHDKATLNDDEKDDTSCCYNKCNKRKYFNGYLTCGTCKTTYDGGICALISIMISCLILGVIIPVILNALVDYMIDGQVVISSSSAPNYDAWQTNVDGPGTDVQIGYDFYFFDVQNPQEILLGAKPIVSEVGPYAYNEYYVKFDISWTNGGDVVTYNTQRYYIFDEERTGAGLSQDDELTLPYATAVAFEYLLSKVPYNTSVMVEQFLEYTLYQKYGALEYELNELDQIVIANPTTENKIIHQKILSLESEVTTFYNSLAAFIAYSNPTDLLLKSLLCKTSNGVQPFWKVNPAPAYFGWLNDPVLLEVQMILDLLAMKTGMEVPWTSAVPGITINFTSIAETRRRRGMDILHTGKKNTKQVSQYVRYNNMTELWSCTSPMSSQNTSLYVEGEQFPACEHYQYDWTAEEAEAKGYVHPFNTNYANRIEGSDANMFGRPVTTEKLQVFISDIYRSCYLKYIGVVDWYGVNVNRYTLQEKDLLNATMNPENAQYLNYNAPSGMQNLTQASGLPSWASFPHFLNGDPSLVGSIIGLDPKPEIHSSYLDVEPNTGLLVEAAKRLQLNYQLIPQSFPNVPDTTADTIHSICENFADIIYKIENQGVTLNITAPDCNNTNVEYLFTCLAVPSDWNYQANNIFMPYSWVEEYFTLPQSDADDLNSSLFAIQDFAKSFQFWCMIVAGIVGGMIIVAMYTRYAMIKELVEKHGDSIHDELEYGYQPANEDMMAGLDESTRSNQPLHPDRERHSIQNPIK